MGRRLDQLLLTDLSPHHRDLLTAAAEIPSVAGALAAGFDDPRTLYRWWFEEAEAHRFLAEKRAQHAARFDGRELRHALGQYATGVTVVTARAPDGRNVGMTANSFTSVSLNPPLVLWCPGKNSPSLPDFTDASHFAVHVLAADQRHLSRQFATPADDKFRGTPTTPGIAGTPPGRRGRPLPMPHRPAPRRRRPHHLPRRGRTVRGRRRYPAGVPLGVLPGGDEASGSVSSEGSPGSRGLWRGYARMSRPGPGGHPRRPFRRGHLAADEGCPGRRS